MFSYESVYLQPCCTSTKQLVDYFFLESAFLYSQEVSSTTESESGTAVSDSYFKYSSILSLDLILL